MKKVDLKVTILFYKFDELRIELGQILWDYNCNNKYCTNYNSKGHTIETCWVKKKDVLKTFVVTMAGMVA
jgi:hypothetical protein